MYVLYMSLDAGEVRQRAFGHVQKKDEKYMERRLLNMDPPNRREREREKNLWI